MHSREVAKIPKKKKDKGRRPDREQKYEEEEDGMGRQNQSVYIKE